jgi:hypothetical protein
MEVLKVRTGIAGHQLAAAEKETELRQQAVDMAAQNVELRKKVVEQQDVVADILKEILAHMKRWRGLADWGQRILIAELVVSLGFMIWLFILAGQENKISDWALPAAIFALAIFAISPAVLLLLERPLKGLDEAGWPGGAAPAATAPAATPADGAAPATTTPAATATAGTAPAAATFAATAPGTTTTTTTTFAKLRPG